MKKGTGGTKSFEDYMKRREAERTPAEADLAEAFAEHFSRLPGSDVGDVPRRVEGGTPEGSGS